MPAVTADMNVLEIIALHPGAADVLSVYGLNCHQCAFNQLDSLDAGARTHGLGDDDIENIVNDLNDLLKNSPPRPKELTLTKPAAEALLGIAKQEGKDSCLLRVTSDDAGGFCMEFADVTDDGDVQFAHVDVDNVALIAAHDTLARIGGSTVDFRDGRFKLDLAKSFATCGCDGKACSCGKH